MWWITGVWTKHSTTISIFSVFSPSCMTNMCLILTVLYVCDAFWLLDVFVCDKNWNKMDSEEDKQALGVKTHKLIFWKFSPDWQVHQSIRLGYGEWHSHLPSVRALLSSNQIRTCCCRMGRTHSQLKDPKVQASHWCDHAHYSFLRWADWHLQLVNPILPTSCFLSLVQNKKKSLFKSVLTLQSKVSAPYQSLADLVFPVIGGSWTPGSKEQGRPGPSPWRRNTGYGGCLVLIGPWWRNVSRCQWAGLSHSWSLSPKRKRR